MVISLMDVNNISFDSNDTIGFSIITLVEITKGLNQHDRNSVFKKFLKCWNRPNYHIYLPHDLDYLSCQLKKALISNNSQEQFDTLKQMCCRVFSLVCLYFTQMIALIVISIVHLNHNFVIKEGRIICNTEKDVLLANFCNQVIKVCVEYEKNQKDFEELYLKWEKGNGDLFGNILFNKFIEKYYNIIGEIRKEEYVLCGNGKKISDVFINKERKLSLDQFKNIYNSYFKYKINDDLTKKIFIPYAFDAIDTTEKFEFNHIADSFLIFNAISVEKNDNNKIKLISKDKKLNEIFNYILNQF